MNNFTYFNPVKLVFGRGMIGELKDLIPSGVKVMLTFGGGSIKKNGVYEQVRAALTGHEVVEFGGVEANPRYETCMRAASLAPDFLSLARSKRFGSRGSPPDPTASDARSAGRVVSGRVEP